MLGRAPLMQVHAAHDAAGGRWPLWLLSHHLAVDHTTLERVIEEERAIEQGRVEDLPRPVPFRNFVAQARLGVSEADHEAYLRAKLWTSMSRRRRSVCWAFRETGVR